MHKLVIYMADVLRSDTKLRGNIIDKAGGLTEVLAIGSWNNGKSIETEDAVIMTIFCKTRDIAGEVLRLVMEAAGTAGEQAIMVDWTGPDGRVMTRGEVTCQSTK
jgi:hypothetical protein